MSKLVLSDIASTESTSIISVINANNDLIEAAVEGMFSLDGSAPNALQADVDVNSKVLYNLPDPVLNSSATPKSYVDTLVGGLNQQALNDTIEAVDNALIYRDQAEGFRDEAEEFRDEAASFVGAATSAQKLSTPRTFTYTGSITGVSPGFDGQANISTELSVANNVLANSNFVLAPATSFKGNPNLASSSVQDMTGAEAAGILPAYGGPNLRGVVAGTGVGTTRFLREDGTFALPNYVISNVPNQGSYTVSGSTQIGDMIRKWGTYTTLSSAEAGSSVFFPEIFPNACTDIQITTWYPGSGVGGDQWAQLATFDRNGFTFFAQRVSGATATTMKINWVAWGY